MVGSTYLMSYLSIMSSENCRWSQFLVISAITCIRPIGSVPFIMARLAIFCPFNLKRPAGISRSSAESPQKNDQIEPSKSLGEPECR